ncbi:nSTAND1 domain-containing NTPase [Mesorhizobium sp. f-mel]
MTAKPYPGLRSFTQEEASLFFGREVQVRQLRDILAVRNLVVVLGGSGSGKSSLVRAGLLPKLNSTAPIPKRSGAWYPIEFRPRTNPTEELFEAIFSQLFQPLLKAPPAPIEATESGSNIQAPTAVGAESLRRLEAVSVALGISPALQVGEDVEARCKKRLQELLISDQIFDIGSLFEFAEQSIVALDEQLTAGPRSGKANLLILIDQFEEVFSLPAETKDAGLNLVMSLVTSIQTFRPANLFLIATMRNEWLHRCSEIPGVAEAMNGSTYLIDLVADSEIRNIIVEPARAVLRAANLDPGPPGLGPFAEETLDELLKAFNDIAAVQHESDRLPLLQHLLPLLWSEATQRSSTDKASFSIEPGHLDAVPGWNSERRLAGCLNANAGRVLDDAVAVASKSARIVTAEARQLMQAAFSNLAVLDEQGIVRRRFASIEKMLDSSALVERQPENRESIQKGLVDGLAKFVAATLINSKKTSDGQSFDINHEALVRNWQTYALWVDQGRSLKTRLRSIDEQIRPAQAWKKGVLSSIRRRLNDFFSAADLKRASDQIGTETADEVLSNVFGPHATFSRSWAGDALHDNDNVAREHGGVKDVALERDRVEEVARIEDRAKDAERFRNNPLNRYRPVLIVLALAGVAILGFRQKATLEREKVLNDVRTTLHLQTLASDTIKLPVNDPKYRAELDRNKIESFAAFIIALKKNKEDQDLQPELRKALTEALFDIEGKWRLDLGGKIWLRPSMTGNTGLRPEDAPCIDPGREKSLRISTDGTVAWVPILQGNRQLWRPSIQIVGGTLRPLDSNLQDQHGEEWQPGSVVCMSPDGSWQLQWMVALQGGAPIAQWPAIRAIAVKTLPKSPTRDASQFVAIGSNRFFVDGDRSKDIYPDLFDKFPDVLSAVRDRTSNPRTSNPIKFVQDGHWVGFQILTGDGKSFTLWTAAGVGDFQQAAPRDVSDCVKQSGETGCIIGPVKYEEDEYNIVVTSNKQISGNPDCDKKGVVCPTSFQLRSADKEQIVRAELRDFRSTQIKGGMITSDGYLILKDDAGSFWQYLLDGSKLADLQKNSWNSADVSQIEWSDACKNLHCKVGNVEAK